VSVPRWLVAAHVAAAAGVLGADLALLALGWRGLAGAEPGSVYPAMHTISAWLLRPAALLAMATGLAAAVRSGSLGEAWVLVKLAVTLALTALVVLVAEPGLADAVADGASISDRTRTTYGVVPVATAVLLLLNVTLGVYRPSSTPGTPAAT
jgi:hypothetical protein